MDKKSKAKEIRKQNRLERLGDNHPMCSTCPQEDWRCFQDHHIAQEAFDDTLIRECLNCHAILSDDQIDHPKQIGEPPHILETIGHFLLGLADWMALLLAKLREFGERLIDEARKVTLGTRGALNEKP